MDKIIYGEVSQGSVQIVEREGSYFIRYDSGAHQVAWREDEITKEEAFEIAKNPEAETKVLWNLQRRLISKGVKPYISNWKPDE